MKISGPIIKQGLAKYLALLEEKQIVLESSPDAGDLCNNFEQNVRRVPRNICVDPAVEAKRAVSACLKEGSKAIKKSLVNCLNEADDAYLEEFATELESLFQDYLSVCVKLDLDVRNSSSVSITLTSDRLAFALVMRAMGGQMPEQVELLRQNGSSAFEDDFQKLIGTEK